MGRFRRLLPRLVRKRLHAAGGPDSRAGRRCLRLRRAEDAGDFRQACKRFIYTGNLVAAAILVANGHSTADVPRDGVSERQPLSDTLALIQVVLGQMDNVEGWFSLDAVGHRLLALKPDFDPRTYRCARLAMLVERSQAFKVQRNGLRMDVKPKAVPMAG